MLTTPMDVLTEFPVRKSKIQKLKFCNEIQRYMQNMGYSVTIESGSRNCRNIIIGDQQTAQYVVTAHYDTPPRMFLPNFITPCNPVIYFAYQTFVVLILLGISLGLAFGVGALFQMPQLRFPVWYFSYLGMLMLLLFGPANPNNANDNTSGIVTLLEIAKSMPQAARNKTCFILFDLEEKGLVGSRAYQKKHKSETNRQIILNLDCVGDGDEIMLFPTKKMRIRKRDLSQLERICGRFGKKSIKLHRKGVAICPSDHKNFPYAVGVMAFNRKKHIGLYCDRIHTKRDTVLDQTNVNIIRAALVTLICQ